MYAEMFCVVQMIGMVPATSVSWLYLMKEAAVNEEGEFLPTEDGDETINEGIVSKRPRVNSGSPESEGVPSSPSISP